MLNLLNIDVLHAMNFTPLFFSFMHYLKEILSASIISITLHIAGIQAWLHMRNTYLLFKKHYIVCFSPNKLIQNFGG